MDDLKRNFISFLLSRGALKFGSFTTKSGRISPYFINTGSFFIGKDIAELGRYYARCIIQHNFTPDCIFGPSYKGIPLAVSASCAYCEITGNSVGYAFNRKEVKDHGEGNLLVGMKMTPENSVVIVDDVITAGLSVSDSIAILSAAGNPAVKAVIISVDRQETRIDRTSAVVEIQQKYSIPVISLVTIDEVLKEVTDRDLLTPAQMDAVKVYRDTYGLKN